MILRVGQCLGVKLGLLGLLRGETMDLLVFGRDCLLKVEDLRVSCHYSVLQLI